MKKGFSVSVLTEKDAEEGLSYHTVECFGTKAKCLDYFEKVKKYGEVKSCKVTRESDGMTVAGYLKV